jgi:hypothetical protein
LISRVVLTYKIIYMRHASLLKYLIMFVVLTMPVLAFAQADPGGDPDVPIDGGLSLLLAAGVGYVAKKGYDKRKRNETKVSE